MHRGKPRVSPMSSFMFISLAAATAAWGWLLFARILPWLDAKDDARPGPPPGGQKGGVGDPYRNQPPPPSRTNVEAWADPRIFSTLKPPSPTEGLPYKPPKCPCKPWIEPHCDKCGVCWCKDCKEWCPSRFRTNAGPKAGYDYRPSPTNDEDIAWHNRRDLDYGWPKHYPEVANPEPGAPKPGIIPTPDRYKHELGVAYPPHHCPDCRASFEQATAAWSAPSPPGTEKGVATDPYRIPRSPLSRTNSNDRIAASIKEEKAKAAARVLSNLRVPQPSASPVRVCVICRDVVPSWSEVKIYICARCAWEWER